MLPNIWAALWECAGFLPGARLRGSIGNPVSKEVTGPLRAFHADREVARSFAPGPAFGAAGLIPTYHADAGALEVGRTRPRRQPRRVHLELREINYMRGFGRPGRNARLCGWGDLCGKFSSPDPRHLWQVS